jgi:hypothetical protein
VAHPELIPKGPADIKIAISGLEMHSGSDIPQDSVEERNEEFATSDDSIVQSSDPLQGKLYISNINCQQLICV